MARRPSTPKCKFDSEEDTALVEAVRRLGTGDWSAIAAEIPGRNARQCRERWNNYANPRLTRDQWTVTEDELLLRKFRELGPKWHIIAGCFDRRAKNSVRNRFFALSRRRSRVRVHAHLPNPRCQPRIEPPASGDVTEIETHDNYIAAAHDPLAFLDALGKEADIIWQTEVETNTNYFL
jgi:hypothetical protein